MRLVCPNCDAEYEVDDAAIPREGRDVQCSSCGHAWFQVHPEVEAAEEAEAELYDAPVGSVEEVAEKGDAPGPVMETPGPGPAAETGSAVEPEVAVGPERDIDDDEDDEAPPAPPPVIEAQPPKPRTLDETVLAVLREEAEREVAARRAEAAPPVMESQTEMPLAPVQDQGGMAAAVRRIAKMRGLASDPEPVAAEPEVAPAHKSRGQMFPAIEEINSTLRATGDRGQDEDDAAVDNLPDLTRRSGGFGRGFMVLIVLAVVIVALYLMAPVIAARVPALEGTAKAYVAAVDAARVWLDVNLRTLVAWLRNLAGGQGG